MLVGAGFAVADVIVACGFAVNGITVGGGYAEGHIILRGGYAEGQRIASVAGRSPASRHTSTARAAPPSERYTAHGGPWRTAHTSPWTRRTRLRQQTVRC